MWPAETGLPAWLLLWSTHRLMPRRWPKVRAVPQEVLGIIQALAFSTDFKTTDQPNHKVPQMETRQKM